MEEWEFVEDEPCWTKDCPGRAITERKRVSFGVYDPESQDGIATASGYDYVTQCATCGDGDYQPFDY